MLNVKCNLRGKLIGQSLVRDYKNFDYTELTLASITAANWVHTHTHNCYAP